MPSGPDKPIRSIKDNPAGKVVADGDGNRWEWSSDEETSRLLKKLANDELAIEKTDLHPALPRNTRGSHPTAAAPPRRPLKPGARDTGGGFNPYDHAGKPPRR
jgi:hypothetical protein